MAQNTTADENADACEECGTTENVQELTLPGSEAVIGYECEDCLAESVEQINADLDAEAEEAAEEFEISQSRENLSPTASHVARVVSETVEAFLLNHSGYGFHADSVKVWNEGDYAEGAGVVLTLPFRDERVRNAFFNSDEDYYEEFPEGVESRLNSGRFEWENGFTFELVDY